MRILAPAALVLTAVSVLVLAWPHGDESQPVERSFVAEMIPHHHLGMVLLADAADHSDDVRLRRLAFEMDSYHSTELDRLDRWADDWSVEPATEFAGNLPGVALDELRTAVGTDHDTLWLALMIEHHVGAIEIAQRTASGSRTEVRKLAARIERVQTDQVEQMQELLRELCDEQPDAAGCAPSSNAQRWRRIVNGA